VGDAEWARRAPHVAPADLVRLVRTKTKPTVEDARARREARSLRMRWQRDTGMLHLRGQLPDIEGARFEATINRMIDRMFPPKGQPWDSREHRNADALSELCDLHETVEAPAAEPLLVVEVPMTGPAEIAGIPLPDAMVEQLRANARIEPVLVDDDRVPVGVGARSRALSPKIARAVLLRDGHCVSPGASCATASRSTTSGRGVGVAPTTPRASPRSVGPVATTACSCRPGGGRWSATPTGPTACDSSGSTN
jgi:Domain of unknown function (DUF222)